MGIVLTGAKDFLANMQAIEQGTPNLREMIGEMLSPVVSLNDTSGKGCSVCCIATGFITGPRVEIVSWFWF